MIRRLLLGVLLAVPASAAVVRAEPPLYVHAEDRAAGNRRAAAVRLARALLTKEWPATVEQVRVDGVNGHQVAGIVLSGVKFHRALSTEAFLGEVSALITKSFASGEVEEVDVWARAPIPVPKGAIVTGDFAVPTSKIVFGCTVTRVNLAHLDELLHGSAVYWEAAFAARLRGPASIPANPSETR